MLWRKLAICVTAAILGVKLSGGLNVYPEDIRQLPIRQINFKDKQDKKQHDALVKLVEEMLELQKERAEVGELDDRRHALKRRIEQVDKEIDELVYELYGLTEEEIRIVEGK